MSTPSHVPGTRPAPDFQQWIADGAVKPLPLAVAFFLLALTWMSLSSHQAHRKDLPLVNPPKSFLHSTAEIKVRPFPLLPSVAGQLLMHPS